MQRGQAKIWQKVAGVTLPLLLCVVLLLAPVSSHALKVPNCQKTYEDLLGQVGDIPAIGDLQNTLGLASTLGGMAEGDIEANLDNIGQMLDDIAPDQVLDQMQNIGTKLENPDLEVVGIMGGSINDLLTGTGLSNFDSKLRRAYQGFSRQYEQETDPAKKKQLYDRMKKISDMIATWSDMGVAAQQSNQQLSEKLKNTGVIDQVTNANNALNKALNPSTIGSDISGLLGQISDLDVSQLGKIKDRVDNICGLMPGGSIGDMVKNVLESYAGGYIDAAKAKLKQIAEDTLTKLKDKLTGKAKEKAQEALDDLKSGALDKAKGVIENAGLDKALEKLGGVTGLLGGALSGLVGGVTDGIGDAVGDVTDGVIDGVVDAVPGVGDVLDAVGQASCTLPKAHEKISCPSVECDPNIGLKGANSGSKRFIQRVQKYFEYEPPKQNRRVYLDKEHHDFVINKAGEITRPPGSSMANVADVSSGGGVAGLAKSIEDQIMNKLEKLVRDLINQGMGIVRNRMNQVLAKRGHNLPGEKKDRFTNQMSDEIKKLADQTPAGEHIRQSDIDRVLDKGEDEFRKMLKKEGIDLPETDIRAVRNTLNSEINKVSKKVSKEIMSAMQGVMDDVRSEIGGALAGLKDDVIPQDKIDQVKNNIQNKIGQKLGDAGIQLSGNQLGDLLGGVGNMIGGFFGGVKDGCTEILPGVTGIFKGALEGPVSEPCQDNRWRDVCLIGTMKADNAYVIGSRVLKTNEEPFAGVAGSSPLYDQKSDQLWCVVPRNTERISPLEMDQGWRYRNMCPGSDVLKRQEKNRLEEQFDIFRGSYACLAPLPKCGLQNDWKGDGIAWKNQEYGHYISLLNENVGSALGSIGSAIGNAVGGLPLVGNAVGNMLGALTDSQAEAVEKLLNPQKSAAPECKPAFWVRLMIDSCANQYILNNARRAGGFNSGGRNPGISPRYCQPFRIKPIEGGEEEYNVADYLHRAYEGLLINDYMPYIEYDRHEGNFANDSKQYREKNWPERKITWSDGAKAQFEQGKQKIPSYLSINDYTGQPVERILDPTHPFSPRDDIAMTVDQGRLTDRNLFVEATESQARMAYTAKGLGLQKYLCVPKGKQGYFETGCTVYCSAVPVDLLRFRYKDFRVCMGCQIKTNERAFWEEYEVNRKYYKRQYCDLPTKHKDCDYGNKKDKEICTACFRQKKHAALAATYGVSCALTGTSCGEAKEQARKAKKYIPLCEACKTGAKAEALERTRTRSNKKKEPKWGPTAMGSSWPVCSTRFDHKGHKRLCRQAKQNYGCDWNAEKAANDPNIGEKATNTAKQCENKDYDQICHDAAKPVYSVNFLKIRTRKGDIRTADTKPTLKNTASGVQGAVGGVTGVLNGNTSLGNVTGAIGNVAGAAGNIAGMGGNNFKDLVDELRRKYADEDPAVGYDFRRYFGNHRPYMRWWDTGTEAFQVKDKPDYWCDWGNNDAVMGVGRDYNSIHGRKAQLCRYGGGAGIGDSCLPMDKWQDGSASADGTPFPGLAGSEWAELKLYQANCFRKNGLNCLCQFEKNFKTDHPEEKALNALGVYVPVVRPTEAGGFINEYMSIPLSWRGYVSTPANRDNFRTNPAMGNNQQFPYAYVQPKTGSIFVGSLDDVRVRDVIIWTPNGNQLPMVAIVTKKLGVNFRRIQVTDANNGKYPDACGNTDRKGRGLPRYIYPNVSEMPTRIRDALDEQVVSTYSCDNPRLGHCVEEQWDKMVIYRVDADDPRGLK